MRYRGHAFLNVRRYAWSFKPHISQSGAAFNPTADHQQNPLQPEVFTGRSTICTMIQRTSTSSLVQRMSHVSLLSLPYQKPLYPLFLLSLALLRLRQHCLRGLIASTGDG